MRAATHSRHLHAALALVATLTLLATPAVAQQPRTPLLIEGKTSLYQKVLTRPGARIVGNPGETAGSEVPPLSQLFVYGQAASEREPFLEVGAASDGKVLGYVRTAETLPWRHSLTLAFTNPANRDRVLFFRDRAGLQSLMAGPSLLTAAEQAREAIAKGALPPNSPVISIEPETFIDLQRQFYILPILEAQSSLLPSGFRVRTVRVASLTKQKQDPAPIPPPSQRANPDDALAKLRAGVVFVVDASSSMQPYIDRTRLAMDEVFRQVEAQQLNERVRFGLVAYRDDPAKVAGMEYLAKVFADPNQAATKTAFLAGIEGLAASKQSTRAFAEDGYAGIETAIRRLKWDEFGARYLVMITDASSREANSPIASTGLSTPEIRQLAIENRIAVYVLHLMTPEGRADHAQAKQQYEQLSNWPNVGSLYFPVEAGDPEAYKRTVQRLAELLVEQVKTSVTPKPAAPAPAARAPDKLAEQTALVGRAMQLAYLGEVQGTQAPPLFEAWASDRDFRRPEIAAFSVRVLLTKNQLSDLQATLRRVVEAGERAQIEPDDFFNQLRSAAVALGRDPSRLGQGAARNLEESGLMGEYLDGLPYQSKLMAIDQDTWTRMGVGEQQTIIDEIKSKIALYQRFHDDVDRWVKLHDAAAAGDAVYPVPIDALP